MWVSKWYFEAQTRKINELERRVKRLKHKKQDKDESIKRGRWCR